MVKKIESTGGKLKIGDHWNAISIIAASQSNPLKAIAEFVENSIDARAKKITIVRGKEGGKFFLRITDNGQGITDLTYVATHIGDSIKRKLKVTGVKGLQGEFGIGLLSFWTVGETLTMTSSSEGICMRMFLVKDNPTFRIEEAPQMFDSNGTDLLITPILPGVKMLSGEKIQNYLACELRDRITKSGVEIRIFDRTTRREFLVEPRKYHGRLLHNLPVVRSPFGEIYTELYINQPSENNCVSLSKQGTRVLNDICSLDRFNGMPWKSRYLEGIIDASFLRLTPGTREGIILDEQFESLAAALEPLEGELVNQIKEQEKAEEDEASRTIFHKVTKAIREAVAQLPEELYGWLPLNKEKHGISGSKNGPDTGDKGNGNTGVDQGISENSENSDARPDEMSDIISGMHDEKTGQGSFFEISGPLTRVKIQPASVIVPTNGTKKFTVLCFDKSKRLIQEHLEYAWEIAEGTGSLDSVDTAHVVFTAANEPGLTILTVRATHFGVKETAQALVTVTADLDSLGGNASVVAKAKSGLPGYTYQKAAGELWRSRLDTVRNLIIINSGHADFIFASRNSARKLRFIARLYVKELLLFNFPEENTEKLLERMIEMMLYIEDNL